MRNSTTHPIYVSWFQENEEQGRLGITLCPGKYQPVASTGSWDRQLDIDIQALKEMGVDRIISLITKQDMQILRVESLEQEILKNNMTWNHLPFADTTAPSDDWMKEALPIIHEIIESIPKGEQVVVHCMGGLSRAGTFACIYMWLKGMEMNGAINQVRQQRSPHAINFRQVQFLTRLSSGY